MTLWPGTCEWKRVRVGATHFGAGFFGCEHPFDAGSLKFPRFRGHPSICAAGVHNGKKERTLHAGVSASDDRAGSVRAKSGEPVEGVRADGASDPELVCAG